MIEVKTTIKFKTPNLNLTKEFVKAGQIVALDMKQGIDNNRDINGHEFPALEASTINKKGHAHPLIDLNVLRRSFEVIKVGINHIRVKISTKGTPPRNDVGYNLQVKGVKQKDGSRKHFMFFGVSEKAHKQVWAMIRHSIQSAIRRARV